jgi:hypothetical protein
LTAQLSDTAVHCFSQLPLPCSYFFGGFDATALPGGKRKRDIGVCCDVLWRDFSCESPFVRFAVIRRTGFVSFSALVTFLTTPIAAPADTGIAARYPGDKNIASDPAVIFADDFESYSSPSQLTTKWDGAYQLPNIRIAAEAGNFFSGSKALEFSLPISTVEVSNSLRKRLSPEQDTVFLRAYTKFDSGYSVTTSNHNGLRLSAKYPGPGTMPPADGTGFFLFLLQNNILGTTLAGESAPGYSHLYVYWPKQRSAFGDHWYPDGMVKPFSGEIGNQGEWLAFPNQYPDFKAMPNFLPQRNRWYCYELMVRANTPGQNDGEVKYWIDGKLISDFPDLNVRSISTLKIDEAHIGLHAAHSERLNKKWYDNVVIATQYIGPMASASPVPSPTPTPTPSPSPTATPKPTPTPTATPTATPTSTPTPTATPTPVSSATPTPVSTPTPTPVPTVTPLPSATPTATPLPATTPTPTPTSTPAPTPAPSPTITPSPTPTPSASPSATATPTPNETSTPAPKKLRGKGHHRRPSPTPTPGATP